jgi:FKBP-type peptidyl-prolyl cis-trans isomerase FklB
MKYRVIAVFLIALLLGTIEACSEKSGVDTSKATLKTNLDSVAYSIGLNLGKNLKNDSLMIDINVFAKGVSDAMTGTKALLTDEQIAKLMQAFQQDLQMKQQEREAKKGSANKTIGDKFLAENKTKAGVKTTESGLQYKIEKEGTGPSPKPEDTVKVHYTGKLLDGKVFDSSVERGQPVEFALNRVIKGWTEGLQLMKEGGKATFYIPSDLAYALRGAPPQIGPNETLIFEVELLQVKPAKK